jgi:SAM-dependent methyltransferase
MTDSAALRWSRLVAQRRAAAGDACAPGVGGARGAGMAERLRAASRRDMTETPVFAAVVGALGPERSVLDIGAGTGRYTVPLARSGCRIWALEPSAAMRDHLAEELAALSAEERARVQVVARAWPEGRGAVPGVEVALASLVVHFCPDCVGFLEGMEAVASRRCVVAIRAEQMHPLGERLWGRFHPDRPFPRQPVLADLLDVLRELGMTPEVQLHPALRPYGRYGSWEEARREAARLLELSTPEALERLDAELQGTLERDGDDWRVAGAPVREAVVSWTPRRP